MFKPLSNSRWNFTHALHLLNRAGFGGTPPEISELVDLGPDKAVERLVDYERIPEDWPNPEWAMPDLDAFTKLREMRMAPVEERRMMQREVRREQRQRVVELRGWWLERMANTKRPLQERMVLFWHGHFATSVVKVRDPYLMWRQNDLFRQHAVGNWKTLLTEASKDPAMLVWLDQAQSRRQKPNENFARELMELFALGEGHYTEKDVTEAARALTGWGFDRRNQAFVERPRLHDPGTKTVLGRTGNLNGDHVIEIVVSQPQAARFITAKLWRYFAETEPSEELVDAMADLFRGEGSNFKPFLRSLFLSEEFHDESVIRHQIKSPVQWLIGSCRMLERKLPPPIISQGIVSSLGQDLFAPPNVKGWDGGASWISTNSLLARYNLAALIVQGDREVLREAGRGMRMPAGAQNRMRRMPLEAVEPSRLFDQTERADTTALLAAMEQRLLQASLKDKQRQTLSEYLDSQQNLTDDVIRNAIRLVMSTPEFQLT